tara:strand:+ start:50953 stop:51837 length:885 start_codon:yes stop_codon:yes gene_type:complete
MHSESQSKSPRESTPESTRVALITGGSSGLGLAIAHAFVRSGYRVVIAGRTETRLESAAIELRRHTKSDNWVTTIAADASRDEDVTKMMDEIQATLRRLDVLINCAGASDRGLIENLQADRLEALIRQNVITALLCSQAATPMLEQQSGVIVNIGSLAGKVGARYIGGYAAAKHALTGMTQQMRLELRSRGIHVALVSPGPIRRTDEGNRYRAMVDESLPEQASAPGGGTRIKGLDPAAVAAAVLRCVERRSPDVILPGHLRVLVAIGHLIPRLGDWLLLKFTSTKHDASKPQE